MMESLQLSQVLADLSNLGAAEPEAAAAIVSANTTLSVSKTVAATSAPSNALQVPQSQQRPSSLTRSWSAEPGQPKLDKYGRRILANTPGSHSGSTGTSTPGTPRIGTSTSDLDADLERASTLMALYDIRSKLKQQDNSSLLKAREKINALAARQQSQQAARTEEIRRNRYSFPKPNQR
ncbi:hypothetical protein NLU13_2242 [Sarocladium strictum]|uniref:Uncharacterized protein n=1 Tax=Sarocladium strictum TaxID=5046 RepID=A0AA39LD18_SARSR|nr:hypothetical protein NLU13_2242 [Sarocladium strictum]